MIDKLTFDIRDWRARLPSFPKPSGRMGRLAFGLAGIVLLFSAVYYPAGMIITHKVDDDPSFTPTKTQGGSYSVDMTIGLIEREIKDHGWIANNPWFFPNAPLDNMPNFQQGMVDALSRFTLEMTDQIGRIRGSSQVDEDLEKAAGHLRIPGDRWTFDFKTSYLPVATAEAEYIAAAEALKRYNARLAQGAGVFDPRADNLIGVLDRVSADIGSASAALDASIEELATFSVTSDDVFYRTKGRLYGYLMLMTALRVDFEKVIAEKDLINLWVETTESLRQAVSLDPLFVLNAAPDSTIFASHLTAQGFYLLRARTQIREISNVLLK